MKNQKNTISFSDTANYLVYNIANYKPCLDNSVQQILNSFVNVVLEYMHFISNKISMKNTVYYNFIFERGFEGFLENFKYFIGVVILGLLLIAISCFLFVSRQHPYFPCF